MTHPSPVSASAPTLGLGILSWRAPATLERTLASYAERRLFDLFDQTLLYFQQIDDRDRGVAARFNLPCTGSEQNLGIYGGVRALLEAMHTDYVLLLENDCPLIEPREQVQRQLHAAVADLVAGRADVYRLRHREHPGQMFTRAGKYRRFYPPQHTDSPAAARAQARLRRWLRPFKARQLIGSSVYVDPHPEQRFPRLIRRSGNGNYIVSSRHLNWTNQSILVSRDWMLNTILPYVATHPTSRLLNGHPNIEKELNRRWWRKNDFRIGIATPGLFTHQRLDR